MPSWFKRKPDDEHQLTEVVTSIAVLIDDRSAFRTAASQAAKKLQANAAEVLATRFHSAPDPPSGFEFEERGLTGWLSAWQFAIFELYFNLGESALPVLRRVAYGEYDWTQGNAIEVLCRIAAKGIDRTSILSELKREFPTLRYEAQLYAVQPLLAVAEEDTAVADVVHEMMQLEEFRETVEELTEEEEADSDNLANENLHGLVTSVESLDEEKWNQHVVGAIAVEGLNYFSFEESDGKARLAVSEETRVQRLIDGEISPIDLAQIPIGGKVAIGFYSFTEQTTPVTIYPESLTLIDET